MAIFTDSFYCWHRWPKMTTSFNSRSVYGNSLQWRHDGRDADGVSNHQPQHCLLNIKVRVTGLYAGNSPVTGEFPAQMASNAENVSIWWLHHVTLSCDIACLYFGTLIKFKYGSMPKFALNLIEVQSTEWFQYLLHHSPFYLDISMNCWQL